MDSTYFDRKQPVLHSFAEKINVNQLGYLSAGEKRAVAAFPFDIFRLVDTDGNTVYEGNSVHFGYDRQSGDDVWIADFSDFTSDGQYRIEAENEKSVYFRIGNNVYDNALCDIERAFYYLRCGTELCEANAGKFGHPQCHSTVARAWSDESYKKDVTGGWHDAGDYGRYVTAGAVAVAHILYSHILFPEAFSLQSLDIPESGSGMPDILSECKYELKWLMEMQREDGGVWHKCTTKVHAPFVMPQDDKAELFLFDVSSMATADFVAVCALAARVYEKYDKQFSDTLKEYALKSYEWLCNNPQFIGFSNPDGVNTGGYGERSDEDNRMWAMAELYAMTGDNAYYKKMREYVSFSTPLAELGYGCVAGLASFCCLTCGKPTDCDMDTKMTGAFCQKAQQLVKLSDECGYGVAMFDQHYCWGSNMNVMKNAMIFIIADIFSKEKKYEKYIIRQADYLFGLNATGYSYVTGCGKNSSNYPHLRPAHADGIDECIPGFVCGGANSYPGDPDARILIPEGTPPMKCYADDVGCYSLNEVTIYWNSPAVFVLAYISGKSKE